MSMSKKLSPQANFFIKAGVITVAVIIVMLVAARLYQEYSRPEKVSTEPTFLYVQTAHSGTLSDEQADGRRILKLNNVSPTTVYFSDRPDRITGHESTAEFIAQWSEGSDSFAQNPPNAATRIATATAAMIRPVLIDFGKCSLGIGIGLQLLFTTSNRYIDGILVDNIPVGARPAVIVKPGEINRTAR